LAPFHAYKNLIAGLVNDNPDTYTLNIGNFLIIIDPIGPRSRFLWSGLLYKI